MYTYTHYGFKHKDIIDIYIYTRYYINIPLQLASATWNLNFSLILHLNLDLTTY